MKPAQRRFDRLDSEPVWQGWPVDQDDRKAQLTGGVQFGPRARSAGVLGDDVGNLMRGHEVKVVRYGEGAARYDSTGIGKRKAFRRIDKAQKVMMLGLYGEDFKVLPAYGEEDTGGFIGQGGHGSGHVGHQLPAVARSGLPRGTLQCQQRKSCDFSGLDGMRAHLGGEGVSGVDDMSDVLGPQIFDEAGHSAKAADALRQGLDYRCLSSPGVRENARNALICKGFGHRRGLGRAAKQKDAGHG